jgi:thioredoxin reductase (NADPH)
MLGVDVLAKSRDIYPIARRVLLTAYSDIEAAVRAINEAHLDHYLQKPWDPPRNVCSPRSTTFFLHGKPSIAPKSRASGSSATSGRRGLTK